MKLKQYKQGEICMPTEFICEVCNNLVKSENFGLCDVCGWESDPVQENDPNYRGGANPDSLNERKAWWENEKRKRLAS